MKTLALSALVVMFIPCAGFAGAPVTSPARTGLEHYPTLGTAQTNVPGDVSVEEALPAVPIVVPRLKGPANYFDGPARSRPTAPAAQPPPALESSAPQVRSNFEGISYTGFFPADPTMAAGPDELVAVVNGGIALFSKAGATILQRSLNGFFNGSLSGTFAYDPKVAYDPHSDRFFVIALDGQSSPNSWLRIAVSKSSSPRNLTIGPAASADWFGFDIDADRDGGAQVNNTWADFPGLGVDNTNLYLTANMNSNDEMFQYAKVWIIPKTALLAGTAITPFEFGAPPAAPLQNPVTGFSDFTIMPAVNFDLTNEHMLATNALTTDGTGGAVTVWTVNNPAGTPTLSSAFLAVTGWMGFDMPDCAQSGGGMSIDTGFTDILNAVERNGSLWATHSQPNANAGATRTEIRWYEINPTSPAVVQFGQVADPTRCYFYPAIHPDARGDAFLVMSGVDSTIFGSIFFTGRLSADPPGAMQPVAPLHSGLSTYVVLDAGTPPRNRWGDFGGIAADPSTGEIWMLHEYAASTANQWSTWFGRTGPRCATDLDCNDGNACTTDLCDVATGACTNLVTVTANCRKAPSQKSSILLKNNSNDAKDALAWTWTKGAATAKTDFGSPLTTTSYDLCVYDQTGGTTTLKLHATAPAGGTCSGKPCWKETATGFKYVDKELTPGGLKTLLLKAGVQGKASTNVNGNGANLVMPALPLTPKVTIQLKSSDGQCWDADYSTPTTVKNPATQFKAKSD